MQALKDVKEYERAFEQLKRLQVIYSKYTITDTHFLYMRGVPFFEETLEASKEILENIDTKKVIRFLTELEVNVDKNGKEYVKAFEKTIQFS